MSGRGSGGGPPKPRFSDGQDATGKEEVVPVGEKLEESQMKPFPVILALLAGLLSLTAPLSHRVAAEPAAHKAVALQGPTTMDVIDDSGWGGR